MEYVTIALSKGRLADFAISLLGKCGINTSTLLEDTRKLVLYDADDRFRFLFVKPSDVPTYVEYGVADIGIVGKDTLLEEERDLYEMLDLKYGRCRLCTAGFAEKEIDPSSRLKVGTKYVNITRNYYNSIGREIEIIKLNGSVELAPLVGLSDIILDIVESGNTLRANGLSVLDEIFEVSARLVVNKVSLKTKANVILPLIKKMEACLEEEV